MKTATCPQYRRHSSKFGEIGVRKDSRSAHFIPRHTPHVSIKITRAEAAQGLKQWREFKV